MISRSWALAGLMTLCFCAPAWAAPVTVQLRVEGATTTLFEGPVTTDAKTITKAGGHRCDATAAANGGTSATPSPTATTALDDGYPDWTGPFSTNVFGGQTFSDYQVERIGGETGAGGDYWGLVRNFQTAEVGGCQLVVGAGDDVLWALGNVFSQPLLRITGPSTAVTGQSTEVRVVDGKNGSPVAGASVGGATTDASGTARVTFGAPGVTRLKASKAGAVRSNALVVSVGATTEAAAQAAPTRVVDRTAPRVALTSLRANARYRRGPRLLAGSVADDGGILQAYFRLRRTARGGCSYYSAKRERFSRAGSCRRARFNRVGDSGTFSYLLPERLPRGRYVLEVKALDRALNVSTRRVRFSVR